MDFAIEPEIIRKDQAIPCMIAQLSYLDQTLAVDFIRQYGEMSTPVTPMYDSLSNALREATANKEGVLA
jgi:hypothetical protein